MVYKKVMPIIAESRIQARRDESPELIEVERREQEDRGHRRDLQMRHEVLEQAAASFVIFRDILLKRRYRHGAYVAEREDSGNFNAQGEPFDVAVKFSREKERGLKTELEKNSTTHQNDSECAALVSELQLRDAEWSAAVFLESHLHQPERPREHRQVHQHGRHHRRGPGVNSAAPGDRRNHREERHEQR